MSRRFQENWIKFHSLTRREIPVDFLSTFSDPIPDNPTCDNHTWENICTLNACYTVAAWQARYNDQLQMLVFETQEKGNIWKIDAALDAPSRDKAMTYAQKAFEIQAGQRAKAIDAVPAK